MYIVKTLHGDIKIDADELQLLVNGSQQEKLMFFRNGAVNTKYIVAVVQDTERQKTILKLPNETDEEHTRRIEAERSTDVFESIRNNQQRLELK